MKVGILSFQGSFFDHSKSIQEIGYSPVFIKHDTNIQDLDALILPGGESTAMSKINNYQNIFNVLDDLIKSGIPTLSTCAGTILLANEVIGGNVTIHNIDIQITRNAYGRQTESFEGSVSFFDNEDIYCFIRAPKITQLLSDDVNVIAKQDTDIVGVQQNNIVALTFHPELNNDRYYLDWLHNFIKERENVRTF